MPIEVTPQDAIQFKQRWRLANSFIAEEIRNTPAEVKLQQLRTMVATAYRFPSSSASSDGNEEVRERWRVLKERLHART